MLLAVLEKRGGLKVSVCDAYMNIIGGLTLDEPAADLAAILALASSYLDKPVPENTAAIGEVGLTGELRTCLLYTSGADKAHKMADSGGFSCAIGSQKTKDLSPLCLLYTSRCV